MKTTQEGGTVEFDVWNMIEGAPTYLINSRGVVRHQSSERSNVLVRRTKIRGRRYVNLTINGKVKRFYIEPLLKEYFGERKKS